MPLSYPSRALVASLLAACAAIAAAPALADPDCSGDMGDATFCAPILACLETSGVPFTGVAQGWDAGALFGTLGTGAVCTGDWRSRTRLGFGQARFSCDDGQAGTVLFTYQDSVTGTATGRGLTDKGEPVRAWSGHNIRAFLSAETGAVDPTLMCGGSEIPLG